MTEQSIGGGNGGPPLDEPPSLLGSRNDPVGLENLRYLGRLDEAKWGRAVLSKKDGEPLRDYISGWVGECAGADPDVAAGIRRLANFIEVSVWHGRGWPHAPRPFMRVTLCGLGMYPMLDSELPGDAALDDWVEILFRRAIDFPGDYSILAGRA